MLKIRYLIRLIQAFLKKFKFILLLSCFLGVLLFFLVKYIFPTFASSSSQRIGIVGKYRVENLPTFILEQIGDGLTSVDETGTVTPNLASTWESSDGGKTWIFKLKDNLTWQDGKKLISGSINYQFSDLTIEKPDEKTFVFKLQTPYASFPSIVSKPIFKKGLLGTGEWQVAKITLSGSFVQEIKLTHKKDKKIIYRFYPTEETSKLAFKLGKVDILRSVFNPEPFVGWRIVTLEKQEELDKYIAVFFNTKDKYLSDKSLRQALSYAINKKQFDYPRAYGPLSPNSWVYNPQVKPYNLDQPRAKQLLRELPKEIKDSLNISLSTSATLLPIAEAIGKNWEEVGVKTRVKVETGLPNEYQAILVIFDIPKDPDQYAIWHSTQSQVNISKYFNPRIDKLLEDGRTILDQEERRKIYLDFQRFLVEDAPAAFLYHPVSYTIKRK